MRVDEYQHHANPDMHEIRRLLMQGKASKQEAICQLDILGVQEAAKKHGGKDNAGFHTICQLTLAAACMQGSKRQTQADLQTFVLQMSRSLPHQPEMPWE